MKKILSIFSVILCFSFLFGGSSVFASNSLENPNWGTPEQWEEFDEKFETGEKKVEASQNFSNVRSARSSNLSVTGLYPRTKGDIIVTDMLLSFQKETKSWTGHAGIVYTTDKAVEAFPDSETGKNPTVDTHRNNWETRYPQRKLYGLKVKNATTAQRYSAADYCIGRKKSAKCYKLLSNTIDSTYVNCSSLIYHGYFNSSKIHLIPKTYVNPTTGFTNASIVTPLSLTASNHVTTTYRRA